MIFFFAFSNVLFPLTSLDDLEVCESFGVSTV